MVDTTHSVFVRRTDFILSSSAWRIAFCHGWHNSYRLRLPHWSHSAIVCLTYRILSWLAPLLPSSSVALISFSHGLPDVSHSVMVFTTHSVFVCRTDLILPSSAWCIAFCHGWHHSFRLRLSHWSHSLMVCLAYRIVMVGTTYSFFVCRTDLILSSSAWLIALSWLSPLIPSSSVALISFCHRLLRVSHSPQFLHLHNIWQIQFACIVTYTSPFRVRNRNKCLCYKQQFVYLMICTS